MVEKALTPILRPRPGSVDGSLPGAPVKLGSTYTVKGNAPTVKVNVVLPVDPFALVAVMVTVLGEGRVAGAW